MTIGVINYGSGNLSSVIRTLEILKCNFMVLENYKEMKNASSYILPGVGNFTNSKKILDKKGWTESIKVNVISLKKPLLGICVGMQLLCDMGSEGAEENQMHKGLGLISGKVENLLKLKCKYRLPHVGWNSIEIKKKDPLVNNLYNKNFDFYFVHSYAFVPQNSNSIIAVTNYDIQIPAIIRNDNVWGTQFHPEKSSKAGFEILKNFVSISLC